MKGIDRNRPNNKDSDFSSAQVHYSYLSHNTRDLITEESVRNVFSQFGEVDDVTIKKSSIDSRTNCQSGYGFIHFPLSDEGIDAAIRATSFLRQIMVGDVLYDSCLTRSLEAIIRSKNRSVPMTRGPSFRPMMSKKLPSAYPDSRSFQSHSYVTGDQMPVESFLSRPKMPVAPSFSTYSSKSVQLTTYGSSSDQTYASQEPVSFSSVTRQENFFNPFMREETGEMSCLDSYLAEMEMNVPSSSWSSSQSTSSPSSFLNVREQLSSAPTYSIEY